MSNKYDTSQTPEGQYQPGSDGKVLLNKLGITDSADMDEVELGLLDKLALAYLYEGPLRLASALAR